MKIIDDYVETLLNYKHEYNTFLTDIFLEIVDDPENINKNIEVLALSNIIDEEIEFHNYKLYENVINDYENMKIFDIVALKWNNHWIFGLFYFRNDKKIFITYSNQELYEIELKD